MSRAVAVARLWGRARLPGDLFSAYYQRIVLLSVARHIFRLLGGDRWAETEISIHPEDDDLTGLKRAISSKREEMGLGAALALECKGLTARTCEERVGYLASVAARYLVSSSVPRRVSPTEPQVIQQIITDAVRDFEWLTEFALRLASDPAGVEDWAGADLSNGILRLLEVPSLARAARFLVIATDYNVLPRPAFGELYASWRWE
jgi:hypothetical protein